MSSRSGFHRIFVPAGLLLAPAILLLIAGCGASPTEMPDQAVRLSVIGTNDVHGRLLPEREYGGITTFSGYVDALRASGASDFVLLVDAGDMWQGTLESNLNEGAAVVSAYNALGYAAAAIGNHEFDFGPSGEPAIPDAMHTDARGALKERAREARFPLLAANLIDERTGKAVTWDNVQPSVILDIGPLQVALIGVVTEGALRTTMSANVQGLRIAPLAETIATLAARQRAAGADLVIVVAHAGSACTEFLDPNDLSSCYMDGEIMRVANALPTGLVDHIVAGHAHNGIAHVVNGIAITSSYSSTRAFGRVDFAFDPNTGHRVERRIYPPRPLCAYVTGPGGACVWARSPGDGSVRAEYEGIEVSPNPAIVAIAEAARRDAQVVKQEVTGAWLEGPFTLKGNPESALGNLFTAALLDEIDADIAIHNVAGGIRSILPAGAVTFGAIYEMFPFDNRTAMLELTGRQLRKIMALQAGRAARRPGLAGLKIAISCRDPDMQVVMTLDNGEVVRDDDIVKVIANDFLALGGDDIFKAIIPPGGFVLDTNMPRTRDVLVAWFKKQDRLNPEDFQGGPSRWTLPAEMPASCRYADAP